MSRTRRSRLARSVGVVIIVETTLLTIGTGLSRLTSGRFSRLTIVGIVFHAHTGVFTRLTRTGTRILTGLFTVFIVTGTGRLHFAVTLSFDTLIGTSTRLGVIRRGVSTLGATRFLAGLLLIFTLFRFILLVFFLLHLVEFAGEFHNFFEGSGFFHASHILLFISREGNRNLAMQTQLELKIQAVNQSKRRNILTGDFEEVAVVKRSISGSKVPAKAWELALDHTLDAGVFNDIDEHVTHTGVTHKVLPTLGGSMKGMGHFVSYQHVVHGVIHILPHGKNETTVLNIERCRLSRR